MKLTSLTVYQEPNIAFFNSLSSALIALRVVGVSGLNRGLLYLDYGSPSINMHLAIFGVLSLIVSI